MHFLTSTLATVTFSSAIMNIARKRLLVKFANEYFLIHHENAMCDGWLVKGGG
jgi:hypothetical protein